MRATFETSITIRMPFGKHRGKTLPECPVNYLVWALQECNLDHTLAAAMSAEVEQPRCGVAASGDGGMRHARGPRPRHYYHT